MAGYQTGYQLNDNLQSASWSILTERRNIHVIKPRRRIDVLFLDKRKRTTHPEIFDGNDPSHLKESESPQILTSTELDGKNKPRPGCKDVWNAYMCVGAKYTLHDIPYCPTTARELPTSMIEWVEAKSIYNKAMASNDKEFRHEAFVCFYVDDYRFDGRDGIWFNDAKALEIPRHFKGIITPDFSTYQDFPEPVKFYNTFRMRAFGYWAGKNGLQVINNVRWGTPESYWYCFNGIPKDDIVCIGTVGGSPHRIKDRKRFNGGFEVMMKTLRPHTVLVYGSSNYPCFDSLRESGVKVITFESRAALSFKRRAAI